jgi:hypothetical protein
MDYEPRGKVSEQIERMRADPNPHRIWPGDEVGKAMGIPPSNVRAYLAAALTHKLLYRQLDNGKSFFCLKPFPTEKADEPLHIPTFKPPAMTPPRGDHRLPPTKVENLPPAAPPRPGPPMPEPDRTAPSARDLKVEVAEQDHSHAGNEALLKKLQRSSNAPAPAPLGDASWPLLSPDAQVKVGTDGTTIEEPPAAEDGESGHQEFDAARWAVSGDIDLYGLVELENGGHRIKAADVPALLRVLGAAT